MFDWKLEIRKRLVGLDLAPTREMEIVEELAQHLEDRYRELLASGDKPEEALRVVLSESSEGELLQRGLRGVERAVTHEPVVLGAARRNLMGNIWQDLRYGTRVLIKNPGFTLTAVITLALGIGANTAIFSILNALLFRPLPSVQQPDQLTYLSGSYSYPDYEYLRDQNEVFTGLFAQGGDISLNLNADGEPELVVGELVTANFFSVLGANPAMGRSFLPDEDRGPGAHPVAMFSYGLWQRRFRSDPQIVGKSIQLNGVRFTIVGVMPRDFIGDEVGKQRDLWVPMMMQGQLAPFPGSHGPGVLDSRDHVWLNVVGRLKPDMRLAQARAAMATLLSQIAELHPGQQPAYARPLALYPVVGGTDPRERGDFLPLAALLLSVVGMVLFTACANVANLLLARASARQKEISIRLALGATRARLVGQLLMESLLLALVAGAAGLLLAFWVNGFLSSIELPGGTKIQLDLHLDVRVLGFTVMLSLLTTMLCGLAPALHASRADLMPALKDETSVRGYRRSRLRNLFVVAQVSLSVLLLLSGGLFLRSLERAQRVDPGFDANQVLLVPIKLALGGYSEVAGRAFYQQVVERMESLPGVHSASLVSRVPLGLDRGRAVVSRDGGGADLDSEIITGFSAVGSRYCKTMGIALMRGREFTEADTPTAPEVAIVNEALARRLWTDEDPVGRRLRLGGPKGALVEVIGLTRDGKYDGVGEDSQPFLYRPITQHYHSAMTVVVRTEGDPGALLRAAEDEVRALDRNLAVFPAETLAARVRSSLAPARLGATLLGIFGLLGLGLAAVGIFGVMAYSVNGRTREIGIRMALGARPSDAVRLVLKEGMILVSAGLILGLVAGFGLAQFVASFLYGVNAADPLTFAGVTLVLAAVAFLACYIPSRRASRVDPMVALRHE